MRTAAEVGELQGILERIRGALREAEGYIRFDLEEMR